MFLGSLWTDLEKNGGLMTLGQVKSSLIWSTESRETQHLKAKKHKLKFNGRTLVESHFFILICQEKWL